LWVMTAFCSRSNSWRNSTTFWPTKVPVGEAVVTPGGTKLEVPNGGGPTPVPGAGGAIGDVAMDAVADDDDVSIVGAVAIVDAGAVTGAAAAVAPVYGVVPVYGV